LHPHIATDIEHEDSACQPILPEPAKYHAGPPIAAWHNHPHPAAAKVQGCSRDEVNSERSRQKPGPGRQFQLGHPAKARSFDVHIRRVVCNVQAAGVHPQTVFRAAHRPDPRPPIALARFI
jgi:hypothetical protein